MPTISKSNTVSKPQPAKSPVEDKYELILTSEIDFSPLNYRKYYSETGLEELAASISLHGIIENLTVRPMPSGRYELITGERRLRAAILIGLKKVPVTIKTLTDDQVIEIQLVENIQSEDPHPMHEARAIGQMKKIRKSIDEIAVRLGKSKAFVYNRIRLFNLIPEIQEIFLGDRFTLTEALEISALPTGSQNDFFKEYCSGWKENDHFRLSNLKYILNQFKYDLNDAPFDKKDMHLIPEMGACTKCPFNSATLKTLFPDEAKEAVCSNKECYERKCTAHRSILIKQAFAGEMPDAILYYGDSSEMMETGYELVPEAVNLPKYERFSVCACPELQAPEKEDFMIEYTDDEESPGFDEVSYNEALEEYNAELEEFNSGLRDGSILKGLFISNSKIETIFFNPKGGNGGGEQPKVSAKEFQTALKAGTATPELLQAEIDRINDRERRAKEIDREKIQISIHKTFSEELANPEADLILTDADNTAARLLVYQSLDYSTREKVQTRLFLGAEKDLHNPEFLYELLCNLTDKEYCFLIRMAVAGKSESRFPNNSSSYVLVKMAEAAGTNAVEIEALQEEKAKLRVARLKERVQTLEMKIKE